MKNRYKITKRTNYGIGHLFKSIIYFLALSVVLSYLGISNLIAQDIMDVPQGVGTLNEAVDSDTLANGERVNIDRIYRLQRGGIYLLEGTIENRGFPLRIVAEDGDGPRPRLIPAVDDQGNSSGAMRVRGDVYLRSLYITNEDELGALNLRIIRASADDIRIELDDVWLDKASQSAFRTDSPGMSIIVRNSFISNIGTTESPNNGRGVDSRGVDLDSLIFENNTFFNLTSRAYRPDGNIVNYMEFNHNTFVNMGQGVVPFEETINAIFTNNMIVNGAFYGYPDFDVAEVVQPVITVDSVFSEMGEFITENVDIRNNNFYLDQSVIDAYPENVNINPLFNNAALEFIAANNEQGTVFEEAIVFTNGPAAPADVVDTWYNNPDGIQPPLDAEDQENFDFSYSMGAQAFSRSTAEQPLGSLIWFDQDIIATSLDDGITESIPRQFELKGNFPNPFNPTTNIVFDLSSPANVSIEIFNVIGQKVMSLPTQRFNAGSNITATIDAANLSSGVYLFRVTAETGSNAIVNVGRMTLIK